MFVTTLSWSQVDWCNLQSPTSSAVCEGTVYTVYAQVYELGVTDAAGQGAGITAWIGYNNADTDPTTWTNWVPATYNIDAGNNDEYKADLNLPAGTYYYASRFEYSAVYSYGGYNAGGGGFWDGVTNLSQVLTVNSLPIVNLGTDVTQCGGSVTLDAANVGSTYLWNDASTSQTLIVSTTGTYYVTVTDGNGCTGTDAIDVTIYTVSPVTITENAGVLTSDATSGNQWYEQTIGILIGETNQTYTPTANGNYYVIVTDVNGCIDTSNVISFLISVNFYVSSSSIIVYPNPANNKIWIDVVNKNASQTKIEIRTLDGRLLFENESNSLGNTRISVDLKEFASGIYIVKAISNENISIQKLVVN